MYEWNDYGVCKNPAMVYSYETKQLRLKVTVASRVVEGKTYYACGSDILINIPNNLSGSGCGCFINEWHPAKHTSEESALFSRIEWVHSHLEKQKVKIPADFTELLNELRSKVQKPSAPEQPDYLMLSIVFFL